VQKSAKIDDDDGPGMVIDTVAKRKWLGPFPGRMVVGLNLIHVSFPSNVLPHDMRFPLVMDDFVSIAHCGPLTAMAGNPYGRFSGQRNRGANE
tara:strand:- start:385 stop:663 length:279 start_codon:yes stop_codon:yes gene_type:complete